GCSVLTFMVLSLNLLGERPVSTGRLTPAARRALLIRTISPREPLLLIELLQRCNQLVEPARDDAVQALEREIDAMVSHGVLREIVGADALAAVAGADEGAPLFGPLPVNRLLLPLVQPAAQDAHGPLEIFVLAALILAFDFQLFRRAALVPDPHRAFSLVDMLAACPAGAHALPFDILIFHINLHLIRLGQDGDSRGRRMDTALLLGLGHTLDAMAAAFVSQVLINPVAGNAKDNFLEATLLAGVERNALDTPAVIAGIVRVHVVEVAGEEGCLIATSTGTDFHDQA